MKIWVMLCLAFDLTLALLMIRFDGEKVSALETGASARLATQDQAPTGQEFEIPEDEYVPTPEELAAVPGRYRLFPNPIGEGPRSHMFLDTASGAVWCGFVPEAENPMNQPRIAISHWVRIPVEPAPDVALPEPGRFAVEASYSYGADRFLVDTIVGRVWGLIGNTDGSILFVEQSVERPPVEAEILPAASAESAPAQKISEEEKR
ncbi:MAG: hypothetical protein IPK72_21380 [Candidatus Eisenbacteria bacterium]|nr:hypothetical protein [Candidatus Eisenbacteria bacterium]